MDDQTRADAARASYAADSARLTWLAIVGIALGIVFTLVGALVDVRSGTWGTLLLGIVILLAGIFYAAFGPRLRAARRRQISHLFDVDPERL